MRLQRLGQNAQRTIINALTRVLLVFTPYRKFHIIRPSVEISSKLLAFQLENVFGSLPVLFDALETRHNLVQFLAKRAFFRQLVVFSAHRFDVVGMNHEPSQVHGFEDVRDRLGFFYGAFVQGLERLRGVEGVVFQVFRPEGEGFVFDGRDGSVKDLINFIYGEFFANFVLDVEQPELVGCWVRFEG